MGLTKNLTMLTSWYRTEPPELWEINVCCLSYPAHGIFVTEFWTDYDIRIYCLSDFFLSCLYCIHRWVRHALSPHGAYNLVCRSRIYTHHLAIILPENKEVVWKPHPISHVKKKEKEKEGKHISSLEGCFILQEYIGILFKKFSIYNQNFKNTEIRKNSTVKPICPILYLELL